MKLDRSKQLNMLQALANVYPRYTSDIGSGDITEDDLTNLWYLKEQGLVEGGLEMSTTDAFLFDGVKITAKGLDFLEGDGGISAILGTLTVRLHADSIKALLMSRVDLLTVPPEKKSWLKKQLETASNETIKKIVGTLVDEGVKRVPDLMSLIEQATKSAT